MWNKETQKPWPEQTAHKAEHKLKHNPQPTIYTLKFKSLELPISLKHFATPNTIGYGSQQKC